MKFVDFFTKFVFLLLTVSVLFISCSSNNSEDVENAGTLRFQTEALNTSTLWSEEIESKKLTEKLPEIEGVSNNVKINTLSINAIVKNQKPVFPYLDGFGSVDLSTMPSSVLSSARKFCKSIINAELDQELMADGCNYELVLLENDLNDLFPLSETNKEENDISKDTKEEKPAVKRFDLYLIGMEIQTNSTCEVPVRFIKGNSSLDMIIYFTLEKENWKIYGFDLLKWENKRGN